MVSNNILLSIFTTNAFPALLLFISSNTAFFYSYGISIDFPEDIIDRNTFIIFVLLFKRLILSEDLELTCRIFLFSSYPQMLLLLVTYFEQNGSIYMQEHQ